MTKWMGVVHSKSDKNPVPRPVTRQISGAGKAPRRPRREARAAHSRRNQDQEEEPGARTRREPRPRHSPGTVCRPVALSIDPMRVASRHPTSAVRPHIQIPSQYRASCTQPTNRRPHSDTTLDTHARILGSLSSCCISATMIKVCSVRSAHSAVAASRPRRADARHHHAT